MKLLDFDENSPKIFQFLFNTDKIIKLYAITGSGCNAIDKLVKRLPTPYLTYADPKYNSPFPHNTVENYFSCFGPDGGTVNEEGKLVDRMSLTVFWMPETAMSIREQQEFVNTLVQKTIDLNIEQKEFTYVIVTHSLWILSDIPSGNINVLNKENCDKDKKFFAGNLYDMMANFSPDIAIGRLSAKFAERLITQANAYNEKKTTEKPDQSLVDFIGDNFIKGYIINRTC